VLPILGEESRQVLKLIFIVKSLKTCQQVLTQLLEFDQFRVSVGSKWIEFDSKEERSKHIEDMQFEELFEVGLLGDDMFGVDADWGVDVVDVLVDHAGVEHNRVQFAPDVFPLIGHREQLAYAVVARTLVRLVLVAEPEVSQEPERFTVVVLNNLHHIFRVLDEHHRVSQHIYMPNLTIGFVSSLKVFGSFSCEYILDV